MLSSVHNNLFINLSMSCSRKQKIVKNNCIKIIPLLYETTEALSGMFKSSVYLMNLILLYLSKLSKN